MVEDKDLLKAKSTFDKTEFEQRVAALYQQAKILKEKGGYSDEEIAERFRVNLMESLRVVQKVGDKGDYDRVLKQLTEDILPEFKRSVGSPAKDKIDTDNDHTMVAENLDAIALEDTGGDPEELAFGRSVVLAGLRDVETFGCDKTKFEAFGGSRLLHGFYGGDAALMEAFNGDHPAASNFDFDVDAYRTWGGCGSLYERFGDKPAELEGKKGAAALSDWLDVTYYNGAGAEFLNNNPTYKNGAKDDKAPSEPDRAIRTEQESDDGQDYNASDVTIDNIVYGTNVDLRNAFFDFLDEGGRHEKNAVRAVIWLNNLQQLRNHINQNPSAGDISRELMKLATKAMEGRSDYSPPSESNEAKVDVDEDILNIPSNFTIPLQKEIAKQAGRKWTEKTTPRESLELLDDLDQDQFIRVLNNGFDEAGLFLRSTLTQPVEDFAKITAERNNNET